MRSLAPAAAAVAATVAAALAVAAPARSDAGAFQIRASYDATPSFGDTGVSVVASGSAIGTDIGAGAWNDHEFAAFTPNGFDITGSLTLTAANGDELFVTYHATSSYPDPTTGDFSPAGTFTIVGGTGRFAGAAGGGTLTAYANATDPATTATLDGTIELQ
jgi:hypothetical protein